MTAEAGNGHGPTEHVEGCQCVRCKGFEVGNELSLRHGAHSERQIVHRATVEKRRLLRQIGLRQDDLESIGRALLLNWSRAAAALHLMDEYAAREGWLDEEGNPRGFTRLYVSVLARGRSRRCSTPVAARTSAGARSGGRRNGSASRSESVEVSRSGRCPLGGELVGGATAAPTA